MIIEIRKVGFKNKGAELMLLAILDKVKAKYPGIRIVSAPLKNAPYEKRALLGLWQKAWKWSYGIQWAGIASLFPKHILESYGIVLDQNVDVILDSAGFAYGDQFGARSCSELASSIRKWKKRGTKVILMPQAFGPFNLKTTKKDIKIISQNSDLIFARDNVSYHHLIEAVGEHDHIKIAPDFTNLLKRNVANDFIGELDDFCIVPNYRMIDKGTDLNSEKYLPFLIKCTRYLINKGQKPYILIHEGEEDLYLAKKIVESVDDSISIIQESDPLMIKGIIGASKALIGSRFHSLVSSLSQGIPALGTGWSHKYQMLFDDYGFSEGIIDISIEDYELYNKIDMLLSPEKYDDIQAILWQNSKEIEKEAEKMWSEVFEIIDL
jgi:polysaccharide pyruvyl transferase WcaK-like protein